MKILIYMTRWKGGVGRVITNMKRELVKQGHEVTVFTRDDEVIRGDVLFNATIESFSEIRKIVRKEKYDILFTQDWSCALPLLNFKNHYCCFHGIETKLISKICQRHIANHLGKNIIVVGDKLKKLYPRSNIVYNGVDFNEFKPLGNKRNKIGWVQKDTEMITKEAFLNIAKRSGLKPTIAKNIEPSDMNKWYNELDTFISYPNDNAGFNLVWLEAKASGVKNVLGNKNGIGIENLNNYSKFTWENSVKELLKIFNKGRISNE